jgi:iron complex transport system substrate-binding protein
MFKYLLCLSICCFLLACNTSKEENNNESTNVIPKQLLYAKRFKVSHQADYTVVDIFGNKDDSKKTAQFILYKTTKPTVTADAYYIKVPVKKVACMSSIYAAMLDKLNETQSIVAIDNVDYFSNSTIITKVAEHKTLELSKGPSIEIEKTIVLNPDVIFTFGMGNPKLDMDQKIIQANIPVSISLDHLEETPLARAEWIKFFACFYDKEQVADSLFLSIEKKYNDLKNKVANQKNKPTVLTEIKYGDAWYVPGGNSYMANLIADAGADYFWKNENQFGSKPLSFEEVYATAKDCDVWINLYNINTKQELVAYDERYKLFKAYSKNKLYNNNKNQNAKGFSNYWETGISNPDKVLADVIAICYPELFPNHVFNYYKAIH